MNDSIQEKINSSSLIYYIDANESKRLVTSLLRYAEPKYEDEHCYIDENYKKDLKAYLGKNVKFINFNEKTGTGYDFNRIKYRVLSPNLRFKKNIPKIKNIEENVVVKVDNDNYAVKNLNQYIIEFIKNLNNEINSLINNLVDGLDKEEAFHFNSFIKCFNNRYKDSEAIKELIEKFIDNIVLFFFSYQIPYIQSISFSCLPITEVTKLSFYNYKDLIREEIDRTKVEFNELGKKLKDVNKKIEEVNNQIKLEKEQETIQILKRELKKLEEEKEEDEYFINFKSEQIEQLENEYRIPDTIMDDISGMFSNCIKLKKVDLSLFKTSDIKRMDNLFFNCKSLESLDLSTLDISKVENMRHMFSFCNSLKLLKLPKEMKNRINCINTEGIFSGMDKINIINDENEYLISFGTWINER